MQEYDIEIKLDKIVKGQVFCRMLAGASNISADKYSGNTVQISEVNLNKSESQYTDLIFYLRNGFSPLELSYKRKRYLRLKANQYKTIENVLFQKNYDYILLRCLEKYEA